MAAPCRFTPCRTRQCAAPAAKPARVAVSTASWLATVQGQRRRAPRPLRARVQGEGTDQNADTPALEVTADGEPGATDADWEMEMSIFKQRTLRPNQLATLRELQSQVAVGKVLFCQHSIAIIEGLNSDAPVGTKLSFVSGATGVVLWWRSESLCFALIVGGSQAVTVGQAVECSVAAILQVVDEADGPMTKREYELFKVPVGASLTGRVVDFLGRPQGSSQPLGLEHMLPMLNRVLPIEARDPINESLLTGVKCVDVLTPIGKGQQMLVLGPQGSGKASVCLDAVLGQKGTGVRCVYAAVGCSQEKLDQIHSTLQQHGAMAYTTVVAAPVGTPLGEQYAAIGSACSIAERVREEGGHSVVVVDGADCAVELWEMLTRSVAALGEHRIAQGLFKSSQGKEIDMPAPVTPQQLVEYEGMMVTAAAAMRRSFITALLQRAARADKRHGGGTTSMLATLAGRPATGKAAPAAAAIDMSKYTTLREDLKQKMLAALQRKREEEAAQQAAAQQVPDGELRTEVIEEFMSISDGQVVLEPRPSLSHPYSMSAQLSVSRIGSRAYYKALEVLAPPIRFALAQAADAVQFSSDPNDPILRSQQEAAARVRAVLAQSPGRPACLAEQVVTLHAMYTGLLNEAPVEQLPAALAAALAAVHSECPAAVAEINDTKMFTAQAQVQVDTAFTAAVRRFLHPEEEAAAAAAAAAAEAAQAAEAAEADAPPA